MKDPWELEPHTEAKHKIYQAYLNAWFPILINGGHRSITYAEGFSGRGVYTGGQPGSPIIALRSFLGRRHQFTQLRQARFLFIEKDKNNIDSLAKEVGRELGTEGPTWQYDDGAVRVRLRQGDCEEELPKLLDECRAWGNPILAILDSYGGGIAADLVGRIAKNRSSEVIYTVQPQHFVRFSTQARGDTVFRSTAWRDVAKLESYQKREHITREFESTMRSEGFTHVLRFNLGTSRGDRLNLLFGTCAELGVEKFKDAMWDADPIQGAGFQDPRDPWQQMLPMKHEPALAPLERLLHKELLQAPRQTMSVGQLRDFTKLKTLFKAAHVTPALKNLDRDRLIERATGSLRLRTTEVTASPEQLDLFG